MHWATFERLFEAVCDQEDWCDALFFRRMAPYIAKYG